MSTKKLVVIGAGNAGLTLVNQLDGFRGLDITVVEKKDHFDMVMQQPRSLVNDAFAKESLWNLRDAVTASANIVQAKNIVAIEGGKVKLELHGGQPQELQADAVVIATGSQYKSQWLKNNDGLNKDAWVAKMAQWRSALFRSQHVMIIGGGLTGVEVASEIATDFPSIKVTVVHKGDRIMNQSEKFHRKSLEAVKALPGTVEFVLGDTVSAQETLGENGPQTYATANGRQIANVDMVLNCVGVTPNTSFLPAARLDPRGYIEVDERLLAPKLSAPEMPVFAIGDCTDKGLGRALVAREQAKALAKGLKPWSMTGNANVVLKKAPMAPVFASLGRRQGIANFPFINNFLPKKMKSPGMFVEMAVGQLGAKAMNKPRKYKLSPQAMAPQPITA